MDNKKIPLLWPLFSKTLYWKLVRAFFVISFIGAVIHLLIFIFLQRLFFDRVEQGAMWETADKVSRSLYSATYPELNYSEIERRVFNIRELNPKIDIFLLDKNGKVIFGNNERKYIPLAPVLRFLEIDGFPNQPILGLDPIDLRREIFVPISASRIPLGNSQGYVYVLLRGSNYREFYQTFGDAWLSGASAFFMTSLVVASTLVGMILFRVFTRRFQQVTLAVKGFSSGDYSQRIIDPSTDELGLHARAFNEMAETIEQNVHALEENDRLRRELIANVSHDLRTPLAAMQTLLETLYREYPAMSNEERMLFLERSLGNCRDLGMLIEDLFELSKLNARTEEPTLVELDLKSLLSSTAKKFAIKAEDNELDLILNIPKNLPPILGDEKMLIRAIGNLVENAIRYTENGGKVRLETEVSSEELVTVSVSDSGIGIPEEDLANVFDRFYRGSRATQKEKSGFGLGLAITKKIIDLHLQEIKVQSEVGEGTSFSFGLAIATPLSES